MSSEAPKSQKEVFEEQLTQATARKDVSAFYSVLAAINLDLVGPRNTAGPLVNWESGESEETKQLKTAIDQEIFTPYPEGSGSIIAYLADGESRLGVGIDRENKVHLSIIDHVSLAEVKSKWAAMSVPKLQ